jgi:hypothetical protein
MLPSHVVNYSRCGLARSDSLNVIERLLDRAFTHPAGQGRFALHTLRGGSSIETWHRRLCSSSPDENKFSSRMFSLLDLSRA